MSLTDQQRIETAADNCEVLRARLARHEDGEGRPLRAVFLPEPLKRGDEGGSGEYGAAMIRGYNACLREVARLNSSPVSAGEPVYQFQCREIGEGDWGPCDHSRYMYCQKSPEHDTRVVQVGLQAPGHGGQVRDGWQWVPVEPNEAIRDAINLLCDDHSAFDDSDAFWSYLLAAAPSAGSQKEQE